MLQNNRRRNDNEFKRYGSDKENLLQDMEARDRIVFIRKVYTILSIQLSFTTAFVGLTMLSEEFWIPIFANKAIQLCVMFMYFGTFCALLCCGYDKKFPINFALLAVFTGCVSFLVATTCARYPPIKVF